MTSRTLWRVVVLCSVLLAAEALYDVFSLKNEDLRDACFDYLKKGGSYSRGPISLLSGYDIALTRDTLRCNTLIGLLVRLPQHLTPTIRAAVPLLRRGLVRCVQEYRISAHTTARVAGCSHVARSGVHHSAPAAQGEPQRRYVADVRCYAGVVCRITCRVLCQ